VAANKLMYYMSTELDSPLRRCVVW